MLQKGESWQTRHWGFWFSTWGTQFLLLWEEAKHPDFCFEIHIDVRSAEVGASFEVRNTSQSAYVLKSLAQKVAGSTALGPSLALETVLEVVSSVTGRMPWIWFLLIQVFQELTVEISVANSWCLAIALKIIT